MQNELKIIYILFYNKYGDYMEKIIAIINTFLNNGKIKSNEYYTNSVNIDLYNEVINLLNNDISIINDNKLNICLLLDTIFQNSSYSNLFLSRLIKSNNENNLIYLNNLIKILNSNKNELIQKQDILIKEISLFNLYERYCKIFLSALRTNTPVSLKVSENIKQVLIWANKNYLITDKELVLLENEVNYYSQRIKSKINIKKERFINEKYEEIPNILSIGFQETDKIEINPNKKTQLDKSTNQIYNQILSLQNYEITSLLEDYTNVFKDDIEYDYILNKIMDDIINELLIYYDFLIDKNLNNTNENRKVLVESYYLLLEKFLTIKSFYDKREIKLYCYEENDDENKKEDINNLNIQKIVYATSEINPLNAKIISDLKDIKEEYYESILELLTEFKNNTLPKNKIKRLVNNGKLNYIYEIKEYQTRIIFKRVENDIICILGIFIKKDTNDIKEYKNIARRSVPQDLENALLLSSTIEDDLFKLLSENKRTSTL